LTGTGVRTEAGDKRSILVVPLKYVERGGLNTRITIGQEEVKFRAEPEFNRNGRVIRRAIPVGPGRDDFVGFAVDFAGRRLYLDLNQNLDLTDDPEGVYAASGSVPRVPTTFADFRNVRLAFSRGGIVRTYVLEPFVCLGGDSFLVNIRSTFEGDIALPGATRTIRLQDNLDGRFDERDIFTLSQANPRAGGRQIPLQPMPLSSNLFIEGRQFKLSVDFKAGTGTPQAAATLEETGPRMGRLELRSLPLSRLILQSGGLTAILDHPDRDVSLPVGSYHLQRAYTETPALVGSSNTVLVYVQEQGTAKLNLGSPFTSSVRVDRRSSYLLLSYILKGAAGEEYAITNPDKNSPPTFVIYRGDRKLAEGSFRFG
jgi:hypothetical protein